MASQQLVPSLALLRSLRSQWHVPSGQHQHLIKANGISIRRSFTSAPRRLDTPQDPSKSFRSQLYESTAQRIQRQRQAEREQEILATGGGISKVAWTFSITGTILICMGLAWFFGSKRPYEFPKESTLSLLKIEKPQHNVKKSNQESCWTDMVEIVGPDYVSEDEDDLAAHCGSEWSSYKLQDGDKPFLIVRPATTEDVSRIMKVCHRRKIPVTPYSGGTSLEGHFSPTRGGICIDFERMDKILVLHKADLDVVVQPALGWEELNEELGKLGLFFPPDPGPGARIGGMVGTGCSGTNAYRYGTMKDWVIALTVVLADGTVIKTRRRPRKSSAGYDLTRLFVGSEGTLGLVTEAVLKVAVKPPTESVAVTSFKTISDAATCVSKVVQHGVQVAAVEILDQVQMRCINDAGVTSRSWAEAPTLFFKFAGTPAAVKEQIQIVREMARAAGSLGFEFARSADEAKELWSARKEALWSVMAKRKEGDRVWTTDVAVPISKLPVMIEWTQEELRKAGLTDSAIVGHAGDGNFHAIMLFNEQQRHAAEDVVFRLLNKAVFFEGTISGEHGIGLVKRNHLEVELGEDTVDLMRKMKFAFDPLCILNCDKIVRVERYKDMIERLKQEKLNDPLRFVDKRVEGVEEEGAKDEEEKKEGKIRILP